MPKKSPHTLKKKKQFEGQKPGDALVKWLNAPQVSPKWPNAPPFNPKFVEDLLLNAQVVFRGIAEYGSLRELDVARKQEKLPPEFWECHRKLNKTLAKFVYAPHIDLHEFPGGDQVSWILATKHSPTAILSVQVRCVLQLIEQGAILKIRRCQQCTKWYFAHVPQQEFCSTSCRRKHQSGSEKFKEERRKYMRDRYWLLKTKNLK
jgi:hypothetical protein